MVFRSIALSCSLLGFLANGAAMAMDDFKEGDARNSPSQKQGVVADDSGSAPKGGAAASSQELTPFKRMPHVLERLIVGRVVFLQGSENKGSTNLALVYKGWSKIVKEEMEVNKPGWMAWYGIIGPEKKAIYERFLKGRLIYRPNPESNEGMITLPISDLKIH